MEEPGSVSRSFRLLSRMIDIWQMLVEGLVLALHPALQVATGDKHVPGENGCQPSQRRKAGMNAASVTLASALQVRGEALFEEEIWSILSLAAEQLLEDLRNNASDYVVCPWSVLLSASGTLSFQDHVSHIESAPFKAPELLQISNEDKQPDVSQMHVYSLGMTLYWSAGFHVPPNQPLKLQEPVHSLLLAMCEDQPSRRRPLQGVLEACQIHHEEVAVYPAPASLHIRRLVGSVLGTISEVERRVVEESSCEWQSRSYLLRKRLHRASSESPTWAPGGLQPLRVSERSMESQNSLEPHGSTLAHGRRSLFVDRPEFILLAGEAPVTLHLPGSIVTKKGKSYLTLRELRVVLLSGQCLEVKCDMESTAGAVFHTVMSFANLRETTYFGLAYLKGKEFFFLDDETRLFKIAPEGWREQPLKASTDTFTLFLRIKFFVSHYGLLQHSLTRHQFYLQLRKDILEERLYCNDETLLQLGVLALQAEFGGYPKEQVETKAYFLVEDYIPARLIERMTALRVQIEVSEMHRLSSAPFGEDAELEFLEISQQLPEYGVLVHQVFSKKKKKPEGEMALGVCAKGVIVYEVQNNCRIATLQFPWTETGKISTHRKKFTITSSVTGKKYTFVTETAKTCTYLLGLCSAQHGFNAQMGSGQLPHLLTDHDKIFQIANLGFAHQAQAKPLTWIQRLSCSENELCVPRLRNVVGGPLSASTENFNKESNNETGTMGLGGSPCTGQEQLDTISLIPKPITCDLSSSPVQSVCTGPQNNRKKSCTDVPGREIVRVTLERDLQRGFGFVINEGDDIGQANPGIFISSLIPGGPAEKAKKIKPGGQILALNHISLEGFTFNMAVRMIQNSPDTIDLIISQSKGVCGNIPREEKNSTANSDVFSMDIPSNGHQRSLSSHMHDQNRSTGQLETAQVQSSLPRQGLAPSPPLLKGAGSSCPPSPPETNAGEIYFVTLVKEDGTLGFSVTGGINTSVLYGGIYVKSIIPGGPAAKEGQILQGDRLLQVDGVSLCGLTHKQAVQCLKGPGKVARLVLERRGHKTAHQCPSANDRMGDEHKAVSLVTARPGKPSSCVLVTDGPKFEVKLKKNSNGLGFSFIQMERESCSHLKSDLVRIKRLFPGQPAEEHGAIAAGDIILAVNGRPTEGLVFQEVLHLLRGSPQEVTLLLCRPPPGVLPEIEPGRQTPVLPANQRFTRAACTDSEQSHSLDQEDSWRDSTSLDTGEGLGPRPESFPKAVREAQEDQVRQRPWAGSLIHPLEPHPHLCKLHKGPEAPTLPTSLETDMRENCYSVCNTKRLGSPGLDKDDAEGDTCCTSATSSFTSEDEKYLTLSSEGQLPCGECLEADSETIPLPQFCSWCAVPQSLFQEGSCGSESDWEDLEETVDVDASTLR